MTIEVFTVSLLFTSPQNLYGKQYTIIKEVTYKMFPHLLTSTEVSTCCLLIMVHNTYCIITFYFIAHLLKGIR